MRKHRTSANQLLRRSRFGVAFKLRKRLDLLIEQGAGAAMVAKALGAKGVLSPQGKLWSAIGVANVGSDRGGGMTHAGSRSKSG